jgi:hypothetical protein
MKLHEGTRFPHPVLSDDTGDYPTGNFDIGITVAEVPERSEVSLDYRIELVEPQLEQLIADGLAGVGIFVTCRDTYFSQLCTLGLEPSRFSFPTGSLVGRVAIRPLIWARRRIENFLLTAAHEEFGRGEATFSAGAVLALADEIIINVGREKLAQIESIFSLAKSPDLAKGEFSLDLDDDKIKILVAESDYNRVNDLRHANHGKPIILNSVYLPAVMQVLDTLRAGAASYEGRRWYKVFTAKCDFFKIRISEPDIWLDAQKLLERPFSEIEKNKELMGE